MESKPRLFIVSSSEGLTAAEKLHEVLADEEFCIPDIWEDSSAFKLSTDTLSNLINATKQYQFAVIILSPDDTLKQRGINRKTARDNVLIELGLFMGSLGQKRTFMVYCDGDNINIPTDLAGIQLIKYKRREVKDLRGAMRAVATKLKAAVEEEWGEFKPLDKPPKEDPIKLCANFVEKVVKQCPECVKESDLYKLYMNEVITSKQYKEFSSKILSNKASD